jgi:NTP pyrophosphatase (non-canonical NTP hydrolase)
MGLRRIQNKAAEIVRRIDEKLGVRRDEQLTISQLVEELGELAKAVNSEKLGREAKKEELEEEFADVFLQLAVLADLCRIDLEDSVLKKIEILKRRHEIKI